MFYSSSSKATFKAKKSKETTSTKSPSKAAPWVFFLRYFPIIHVIIAWSFWRMVQFIKPTWNSTIWCTFFCNHPQILYSYFLYYQAYRLWTNVKSKTLSLRMNCWRQLTRISQYCLGILIYLIIYFHLISISSIADFAPTWGTRSEKGGFMLSDALTLYNSPDTKSACSLLFWFILYRLILIVLIVMWCSLLLLIMTRSATLVICHASILRSWAPRMLERA